jgi:ectoine hydroxylase-related dioxygenase (phytanoyl-CoA dioxygenase family)
VTHTLSDRWWNRGVDPTRDLVAELDALLATTSVESIDHEQARDLTIARLRAAEQLDTSPTTRTDPGPEPFDVDGVPEVPAAALDAPTLSRALHHHGALLVRGLLSMQDVTMLRADLQRMIDERQAQEEAGTARRQLGSIGNCQASESPVVLTRLLDAYRRAGLVDTVQDYFGRRPVVVAERVRLRRDRQGLPWHQDAAFFGGVFGAVNAWIALTSAGVDRDGLAVIPRRVEEIYGLGEEYPTLGYGAQVFNAELIDELCAGRSPAIPAFEPGDALLFDEMTVHRTHAVTSGGRERDVAVTWFFSPDLIPTEKGKGQWTPLAI